MMKRYAILRWMVVVVIGLLVVSCAMPSSSNDTGLEETKIALAIQQTGMAMDQTSAAQAQVQAPTVTLEPTLQFTYTPYPTYTSQPPQEEPPQEEQPPAQPTATQTEAAPAVSFEDWLEDVDILLYDDMYGLGESPIVENAIDGLGLGRNTKNVGGAMGDFLTNMNSATQWDLIIIAAESRDSISGEYFDVIADQMDRGTSIVIEIWYIDDIAQGRIQPVMQRCGISFQRDWWRAANANLNDFLVYLLDPSDPLFSEPNTISMLIPSASYLWIFDIGDLLEVNAGSDAKLLAGALPKEYNSYGAIAECLDGRMIWQTFSTHDYKYQEMINLWQNYVHSTLKARYEYLQENE